MEEDEYEPKEEPMESEEDEKPLVSLEIGFGRNFNLTKYINIFVVSFKETKKL